ARTLADATEKLIGGGIPCLVERAGLYHMSASGETTWCRFARAIVGKHSNVRIVPITTAEYPTPARRPSYGVLDTRKFERTFGFALPPWQMALQSCVATPGN